MMGMFSPHNTAISPANTYLAQPTEHLWICQILSAATVQLTVPPNDEEAASPDIATICLLPNELLSQINSYLDPVCLAVLSITCKVCHLRADPMIPFRLNIVNLIYRSSAQHSQAAIFVVLPSIVIPMSQTLAEKDRYMSCLQSS
jgi:hypothetical protein